MSTFMAKPADIQRKWYIVDAANRPLGRTASGVKAITLREGDEVVGMAIMPENGKLLTEVTFRVDPNDVYVRITVIDEKGYPANTNAYFTSKLFD